MSFKAGIEQWNLAVQTYEAKDYHNALLIFTELGGTAKIHFNIGIIYGRLGQFDLAISSFTASVQLDNYLAVAYFARALANIELKDYEAAFEDFNDTILYLRGNQFIDYLQLGLDFKLYSCEVLYNRSLCYFKLGSAAEGMNDLLAAIKEKKVPEHDRINRAVDDKGKTFELFRLPVDCLFRPGEGMIKNSKKVDYLGQAKVIAASKQTPTAAVSKPNRQFPEPAPFGSSAGSKLVSRSGTISGVHYIARSGGLARSNTLQSQSFSDKARVPLRPGGLVRSNTAATSPVSHPSTDLEETVFEETVEAKTSKPTVVPRTPPAPSGPDDDCYLLGSKPLELFNPSYSPSPSLCHYEPEAVRPRAPVPHGKMKIKCHYSDTRTLMVAASIQFNELEAKIKDKFSSDVPLKLKYKDEDDELVLITDQEDLDMALASLCSNSDGTMSHLDPGSGFDGRFELWCSV